MASSVRGITLASASPRRLWLARALALPIALKPVEVNEGRLPGELPSDMVVRLSRAKALAAPFDRQHSLVLGSDTVVSFVDGGEVRVLGKPGDREDLAAMVASLAGRLHTVYTGYALRDADNGGLVSGYEAVEVRLRHLSAREMEAYLASGIGDDKAGGYALQDRQFRLVEQVRGCAAAAVGLPLRAVWQALRAVGVTVPGRESLERACGEVTGMECCLGVNWAYAGLKTHG